MKTYSEFLAEMKSDPDLDEGLKDWLFGPSKPVHFAYKKNEMVKIRPESRTAALKKALVGLTGIIKIFSFDGATPEYGVMFRGGVITVPEDDLLPA